MTESNQTQKNWEIGEVTFNDQGDVQFTLRGVKVAKASDFRLISAAPELLKALHDEHDYYMRLDFEENSGKILWDDSDIAAYHAKIEPACCVCCLISKAKGVK